jgi:hypothetical protein
MLLCGLAAACTTTPITVAPSSVQSVQVLPRASDAPATVKPAAFAESSRPSVETGPQCAVRLADVRDVRPDPNDLGMMIGRAVHASDSVAWFRVSLETLKQDGRLRFVDADADAQLVLRVELVKAYIMVQNTQKSSDVVIRVVYSRDGKDFDTQIVRGRDEGANWVNGEDEAQGSLNRALAAAVGELDSNIGAHCRAAQ